MRPMGTIVSMEIGLRCGFSETRKVPQKVLDGARLSFYGVHSLGRMDWLLIICSCRTPWSFSKMANHDSSYNNLVI